MVSSCDCGSLSPLVTVAWKSALANHGSSAQMIGSMIGVNLTVGNTFRNTLASAAKGGLSSGLFTHVPFLCRGKETRRRELQALTAGWISSVAYECACQEALRFVAGCNTSPSTAVKL